MITKRIFNPVKVFLYVKLEVIFSLSIAIIVYGLVTLANYTFFIPFSIAAILGSALAIFIAFRNNSAYSRWWEARTLWGGIVNSSRVLGRLLITFSESHVQGNQDNQIRARHFQTTMVYLVIAWSNALRLQLRGQQKWQEIRPFLDDKEFHQMLTFQNKPNFLQLLMGKKIYEAMGNGTLAGFDSFQIEGQLLALVNYQGGCERIKNTPLLRQYDFFTRLFLYTFIFLLPFSLAGDFLKGEITILLIPISVIISFVFAIIAKVGEVNEDPFENRITDIPLSALTNTIEIDLKQMVGETVLPDKLVPQDGYLF